jgi:hypothetical protein
MSRPAGPIAWVALTGAMSAVVFLALFYIMSPVLRIEFAVDPPRLMTGMHHGERDQVSGLTFAWTGRDVALRLPGLDRSVEWAVDVRVRGNRADASDNPTLVFFVDGLQALTRRTTTTFETIRLTIPSRPDRPQGVLVGLQSSSTFVPGPDDPRSLGVMVDAITLTPQGLALPPRTAFTRLAAAGAVMGGAIALTGLPPVLAAGAAALLSAGQASVVARGFGPFTDLPRTATRLAIATGATLVLMVFLMEQVGRRALGNTARFTAAFAAGAVLLKLLVLLHPHMPIGDALFHAHRFQEVLRGNYYFTSIAPGGYAFPYAPGLYLAASPFADLVRRESGDVVLLRVLVTSVDGVAGVLLYAAVVRAWGDRLAAAIASAVYQSLPLAFLVITVANLTNAFAQSLAVVCLAMMSVSRLRVANIPAVVALGMLLAAAFLSHTSTFAILSVTAIAAALLFTWRGGPSLRAPAGAVLAACAASAAFAVIIYYGHFIDTYRTEFARIGSETAAAAPDAGGRGIAARALAVPRYLSIFIGLPALILAAAGAVRLWRRGARDNLTLVVAAWCLTCAAFLLLGVFTPVDMRHYLASLPAVAILAGAGASGGWAAGGRRRLVTTGLLGWAAWLGIVAWWTALA